MKKQLLKERLQELAGIKSLHEFYPDDTPDEPGYTGTPAYGDEEENKYPGIPQPDINSKTLLDLIARDLKFAGFYQNPEMLAFEDAVEIMDHVIEIEGADYTGLNALLDYIQEGEFDKGDKDVYIEPKRNRMGLRSK